MNQRLVSLIMMVRDAIFCFSFNKSLTDLGVVASIGVTSSLLLKAHLPIGGLGRPPSSFGGAVCAAETALFASSMASLMLPRSASSSSNSSVPPRNAEVVFRIAPALKAPAQGWIEFPKATFWPVWRRYFQLQSSTKPASGSRVPA